MNKKRKNDKERKEVQIPAMKLLEKLGWKKIDDPRKNLKNPLLEDILYQKLDDINSYYHDGKEYKFKSNNIRNAMNSLRVSLDGGLNVANMEVYNLLNGSRSFKGENGRGKTFKYIDDENIENNKFNLIEEYNIEGRDENIRVDIVLFVNGIPMVTIECKAPDVEVVEGVTQNIRNQRKGYAPHLFKYIQLTIATNKNKFLYGTCKTPKRFYSVWKEQDKDILKNSDDIVEGRKVTEQDRNFISILSKERFFDIFKNFIVFDNNVKKVARYQQYFAVKKMLERIKEKNENGVRNGGVIWHTQGSGKSLTMVMLTKAIVGEKGFSEGKVVVVTDRVNLDNQITQTFRETDLRPHAAGSGKDLVEAIHNRKEIITTTVHKFEKAYKEGLKNKSKDIFILVDESHRTEYGKLNEYMEGVFPNACYIGFTGTPLMKGEEKNTMDKFGGLIHKYTIQDAVEDGAIVPLIYEGKMPEQDINEVGINNSLDRITKNLNEKQTEDLKKKWANYSKLASSRSRIEFIAFDIYEHFLNQFRRNSSKFKAMLATNSKAEAVTYLRRFEDINKINDTQLNVAVMVSAPDTREGYEDVDKKSNDKVIRHWEEMMKKYGDKDNYENSLKDEFKNGDLDLMIVVDKLLTGFDAPRAIALYIDKKLKEHNLLQAVARVNRLHSGKDAGFIIDYRGLLTQLNEAMDIYSGAGLENFDPEDIKGALVDIEKIAQDLITDYSKLEDFFSDISNKDDMEEYEQFLEEEEDRDDFYEYLSKFSRDFKTVLGSLKATDCITEKLGEDKLDQYKKDLKYYQMLRRSVKIRYSDGIDFKEYEDQMQNLLDTYVNAKDILDIVEPVDIMNIKAFDKQLDEQKSDRAKADMIRTRVQKSVKKIEKKDPVRFKKFSDQLKAVYEKYKKEREKESNGITEKKYLAEMKKIKEEYQKGREEKEYPTVLRNNKKAQIIYDLIEDFKKDISKDGDIEIDESSFNEFKTETSLDINTYIKEETKPEWYKNTDNTNEIKLRIIRKLWEYIRVNKLNISMDKVKKISNDIVEAARQWFMS